MKKILKRFVERILDALARIRIKRLRPFIIGITGSVGKTSTKDAIYTILKTRYGVLRSEKSFNTEFGLPLAILEQSGGFSSPLKWLQIIFKSLWQAFFGGKNLQMMVLEMGTDKPGDMDQLLRIVRPQIGVMTAIQPVHLAPGQFKDMEDIFMEKSKLVTTLPEKGIAILNGDDPYLAPLRNNLLCKKLFYGFHENVDLRVLNVESGIDGLAFTLSYKDETAAGVLPILGNFQLYVLLPAIAVALTQGFTLVDAIAALKDYQLPPGRMNIIPGVSGTVLIDSSYNASPEAMKKALELLSQFKNHRRIAILGNMNELGEKSEYYHREIGRYAVDMADIIITVGDDARWIFAQIKEQSPHLAKSREAIKAGPASRSAPGLTAVRTANINDGSGANFPWATHAAHVPEVVDFLRPLLQKGDIILVKGSQNRVRLERLVKMLMNDPSDAETLLVRQEKEWLNYN